MLFVLVVQLFSSGPGPERLRVMPVGVRAATDPKAELDELREQAIAHPCADTYTQLSLFYERAGDYRKAMYYLREADAFAQADPE